MLKDDFLQKVNDFLIQRNISATAFGILAIEDPTFVLKLRRGRECREATQQKILDFMDNYIEGRDA